MPLDQRRINGLQLFASLIKDGCTWQGDVNSRKWAECLYFDQLAGLKVGLSLAAYVEGDDYKLEKNADGWGCVWIA